MEDRSENNIRRLSPGANRESDEQANLKAGRDKAKALVAAAVAVLGGLVTFVELVDYAVSQTNLLLVVIGLLLIALGRYLSHSSCGSHDSMAP